MTRERAPDAMGDDPQQYELGLISTSASSAATSPHYQQAREAAEAALTVWTREHAPVNWANGQMTLGNALHRLGAKETGTETLSQGGRGLPGGAGRICA